MFDGAVFTLSDQGRTSEQDGYHGYIVGESHGALKAFSLHIGVELGADDNVYGLRRPVIFLNCAQFPRNNMLDITSAGTSQAHGRGIHIELDHRWPPGKQIRLKSRWNIDDKSVMRCFHAGIDLFHSYLNRWLEMGLQQGITNSP